MRAKTLEVRQVRRGEASEGVARLRCTPRLRCLPEQSRHIRIP